MWFLLLTLLESGDYTANSVHATLEDCERAQQSTQDTCARVTVRIIELPTTDPISTTELAPIEPPTLEPPPKP